MTTGKRIYSRVTCRCPLNNRATLCCDISPWRGLEHHRQSEEDSFRKRPQDCDRRSGETVSANDYHLRVAATSESALSAIRRLPPVLIHLDRQIVTKETARRGQFPSAMATSVIQPFDKSCDQDGCLAELIAGFDMVFCSPYYRKLLAHIRAMLRRHHMASAPPSLLRADTLAMDADVHRHDSRGGIQTPVRLTVFFRLSLSRT